MKAKRNETIRELRKIIGRTQEEFAAMIGASKDTVVSWELGRNKLSAQFARRIAFATGAEEEPLLRGRGPLTGYAPRAGRQPFTAEFFERHRKSYWGRTDEEAARTHYKHCADALKLLFLAATKPRGAKIRHRLPGVVDSFIQWCERTREDFQLEDQIDELLKERSHELEIRHSYGEWREMQKTDPEACRTMGFEDDPTKSDSEVLTRTRKVMPLWLPGRGMRGG